MAHQMETSRHRWYGWETEKDSNDEKDAEEAGEFCIAIIGPTENSSIG